MLATTTWFSLRASASKRRCPAWSAPMVGTKPMLLSFCRLGCRRFRRSAIDSTTSVIHHALRFRALRMEMTGSHVFGERASRFRHGLPQWRVAMRERRSVIGQAEQVVTHQHLSVAIRPGPDSDGWDLQLRADLLREIRR